MAALLTKIVAGVVGIGVSAAVVTQVTQDPAQATPGGSVAASVVKIVDGDTLDVRYADSVHRIRMLNVDAPESKDPNRPVECLGQAATDFLAAQLPVGTSVTLEFDEDLLDPYDRELAGVVKDGVLVNAEIARSGLGVPVYFSPNDRFLDAVESAHEEARTKAVGLYDVNAACSIPAQLLQLQTAEQQLGDSAPAKDAGSADIDTYLQELEHHRGQAAALLLLLQGDATLAPLAGYTSAEVADLTSSAKSLDEGWAAAQKSWQSTHTQAVERESEEQAAREAEEEAAREAQEKAAREAEEKAEQQAAREAEEKAAREAEKKRQAEEEARRQAPPPAPAPPPPPATSPGAGYTGCRAYIGGPYIDDQGRRYTPIDCKTKEPLVP